MARACEICGKTIAFGNNVSHSNRKTPRSWKPNLQTAIYMDKGKKTRKRVCTRCLKKGKVIN